MQVPCGSREKVFNRVPMKVVEWAMRKKGLPETMVKAMMGLYDGTKMRVRVGTELLEEFYVKVGVYQGSLLSPLLFMIVVDETTADARESLLKEIYTQMTWFC